MKRILYTLIIATALAACQDELTLEPAVSFFAPSPEILDDTAIFRLAFANITDSTERAFPVRFGGTAELGTDYTVSGDRFIFGGSNPVDSIVVTTLNLGTEKTLSLTIDIPEGYASGKYTTSEYTLQDRIAYLSFDATHYMFCDTLQALFSTRDKDNKSKRMSKDVEIKIVVDKEKSTAVEGIDFQLDSLTTTVKADNNNGYLTIRALNPHPQEGKDKIVLTFDIGDRYSLGQNPEMEISLLDTLWRNLDGKWKIGSLITDAAYMEDYWKEACTLYSELPKFKEEDSFTINLQENIFKPAFKSDFSNYFFANSGMRKGKTMDLDLGNGKTAQILTFLFDRTDRYFLLWENSEDKESYVGLRLLESQTGKKDSLDMYIIDHTSRAFMPELETSGKYASEKPVAASPGLYLNATFNKQ